MPADARREPPSDAGHGGGRPPDGPPEGGSWAFARGLKSMFGWPQQDAAPALPPLTASGLRAQNEDGHHAGGVHRLAAPSTQVSTRPNVVAQQIDSRLAQEGAQDQSQYVPPSSGTVRPLTRPGEGSADGVSVDQSPTATKPGQDSVSDAGAPAGVPKQSLTPVVGAAVSLNACSRSSRTLS